MTFEADLREARSRLLLPQVIHIAFVIASLLTEFWFNRSLYPLTETGGGNTLSKCLRYIYIFDTGYVHCQFLTASSETYI